MLKRLERGGLKPFAKAVIVGRGTGSGYSKLPAGAGGKTQVTSGGLRSRDESPQNCESEAQASDGADEYLPYQLSIVV